ncbi:MAG: cell division protein FtsZ, partial [Pseudomonadota bacterium]
DEVSLKGAKGVLINITGGYDLTLFEMDEAANRIKDEVDGDALIKFGSAIDPDMEGRMRVSVVATGIDAESSAARADAEPPAPQRRRPVLTESAGVDALRGGQARQTAEPARGLFQRAAGGADADAEVEAEEIPEVEAPAPVAAAPAPEPADPVERRVATSPTPDEIRQRAERVRQAALAARAEREAQRPAFDDDAVSPLFELDDDTVEGRAEAPMMRGEAARRGARPVPEMAPEAAPEAPARTSMFTINRLINRVAGQAQPAQPVRRVEPRYDPRADERDRGMDEDEGDVPAFLRRQAN